MLRISSNAISLNSERWLSQTQRDVEKSLYQLSSGSRFNQAGDDPAGHAIAENMNAQIKGYQAAKMNAENATSFVQIAESALNEQNNILIRMRELAIQASSDTFSDTERGYLDTEFQQINNESDRIAKTTKFGSQALLTGSSKEYEFQVGINSGSENVIKFNSDSNTTSSALGTSGLSVADKGDARDSLESIDEALTKINQERAKLGAVQNRMDHAINHIESQVISLSEAHSKMADADIAQAVSQARRGQILQQYQAAALNMSMENQQNIVKLIA